MRHPRRHRHLRHLTVGAALLLVASACGDDSGNSGADDPDEVEDAADTPDTGSAGSAAGPGGWEVADPEDADMDAGVLEEARDYAFTDRRHTQGVVVVRHGTIVAEWYADGNDQTSWASSWSMAKSVASALIGIAIDEGHIPSVDEPMSTYYPEWAEDDRAEITLRDVLQQASGLDWVEAYDPEAIDESNVIDMVLNQEDQLAYASGIEAAAPPGTEFNYSSGNSQLLDGVLEQATGMPTRDYAREVLFDPLGMERTDWWVDAEGHTLTYCCLDSTSRDYARFGQLYLQDGDWAGEQVVPADWVAESTEPSPAAPEYGYQWWLTESGDDTVPEDLFAARGNDGQFIYVIPSLDLVVVRNSEYNKFEGEAVADPNLFERLPNSVVPERGTRGAEEDVGWDDADFLGPIVESIG